MDANIATPAALIGDPTRAAMLQALQDGRAQPASALAWAAGVTAQAASNHLAKLVDGGLLAVEREGRHRYYRLASAEVAHAIEALSVLAAPVRSLEIPRSPKARALRDARCCYGHLAGRLGVRVCEALVDRDLIRPADGKALRRDGRRPALVRGAGRRRGCAALAERRRAAMPGLDRAPASPGRAAGREAAGGDDRARWLALEAKGRAVRVTVEGAKALRERLGVWLEEEGRVAA
jgi:DNA-binding transcriptional ArsR family regulator